MGMKSRWAGGSGPRHAQLRRPRQPGPQTQKAPAEQEGQETQEDKAQAGRRLQTILGERPCLSRRLRPGREAKRRTDTCAGVTRGY